MFAGAVVFDLVASDELFSDGDLEVVTDDGDLDLAATEHVPGPIAGPAKQTFPDESTVRVTVTPTLSGAAGLFAAHTTGHPGGLLGRVMAKGVGGSPNGIRTRAATLRGWCPRPLDDGAVQVAGSD